jgi:phosphatidylinositol alpha-mannosyltransferase
MKRIEFMFSPSPPARDFAKKYYLTSSEVVQNFVDINKYRRPQSKINNEKIRVLFLGRLVKRKGCGELLNALSFAIDKKLIKRDFVVDVAGDGPDRQKLKRYCQKHNLAATVKFHGFISEEEKISALNSSDIAVFPSTGGESFGIVLIEAMAAGAAVIAGNNPGYRSVLSMTPKALFTPEHTPEFASLLAEIINNQKFRADIVRKQQARLNQFDINTVGKKILASYQKPNYAKINHRKTRVWQ